MIFLRLIPIVFAGAWQAFAQSNIASNPPQRVVTLSVGASNAQGMPVTDLRPADLQVREDGKPRPIVFFRFTGSQRSSASPAPGEFANHREPTPTVILLDRLNDDLRAAAAASNGISAVLQRMASVDRVYIYVLTNIGELFPVQPLPSAEPDSQPVRDPTAAELRTRFDNAVRKLNGLRDGDNRVNGINRANKTLQLLDALFSQMGSLPGRKNLIWVTGANYWAPAVDDIPSEVRGWSAAAFDSEIAVFTVDQSASAGAFLSDPNFVILRSLSAATGGVWYPANEVEPAFADAIADARSSYTVAYYSSTPENGKEPKIRIDSARKGIRVRLLSRAGDAAQAGQLDADVLENTAFDDQLRSSIDAAEIGLRVGVSRSPGKAHFRIHIDPADVFIEPTGSNYQVHLTVLLAPYSDHFEVPPMPVDVDINLTPAELNKASKDGIVVTQDVSWNDKVPKMRVIVFDRGLHGIGSVTVPAN